MYVYQDTSQSNIIQYVCPFDKYNTTTDQQCAENKNI